MTMAKCIQCGRTFAYNDEVGYYHNLCCPLCDGIYSQRDKIERLTREVEARGARIAELEEDVASLKAELLDMRRQMRDAGDTICEYRRHVMWLENRGDDD